MPILSQATYKRLAELARRRPGVKSPPAVGGNRGRLPLLVQCTSDVAAGGSGIAAQCYPGVIIDPQSAETTQPTLGDVWLTVLGDDGDPVEPTENTPYLCLMGGDVEAATGDVRPRAFGVAAPAATTSPLVTFSHPLSGSANMGPGSGLFISDTFNVTEDGTYLLHLFGHFNVNVTGYGTSPPFGHLAIYDGLGAEAAFVGVYKLYATGVKDYLPGSCVCYVAATAGQTLTAYVTGYRNDFTTLGTVSFAGGFCGHKL